MDWLRARKKNLIVHNITNGLYCGSLQSALPPPQKKKYVHLQGQIELLTVGLGASGMQVSFSILDDKSNVGKGAERPEMKELHGLCETKRQETMSDCEEDGEPKVRHEIRW